MTDTIRDQLFTHLANDLLGPAGGAEEQIDEAPATRYLCGMLAPFGTEIVPDQDEDSETAEADEEEADVDSSVPYRQTLQPSSIGISCFIDSTTDRIVIKTTWGKYERQESGPWKRSSIEWRYELPLPKIPRKGKVECPHEQGVHLDWLLQPHDGGLGLTVFIVNGKPRSEGAGRGDANWLFQPQIVLSEPSDKKVFLAKPSAAISGDADTESNRLLFRKRLEFAVGHGVSAVWEGTSETDRRAAKVRTEVLPSHTVPMMIPFDSPTAFSMKALSEVKKPAELKTLLSSLPDEYEKWIGQRITDSKALSEDLRPTAETHLANCRETAKRIRAGIDCVLSNDAAFLAFRFANHAMYLQRTHTVWAAGFRKSTTRDDSALTSDHHWRPFQLAFILISIPGIVDPFGTDRGLAELLWFPTGGGKTEAYLGLTAFTFAFRRRRKRLGKYLADAGVNVIMRYTLRMLTIQQFQRAATLITACELIRKDDSLEWGPEPFRIGLWVGRDTTPNRFNESKETLARLHRMEQVATGNPMQLTHCPWCGERLTAKCWVADTMSERTLVYCPRAECELSVKKAPNEGIPVVVVDDEIFRLLPALIIATVDKFARLPWIENAQALFGKVSRKCSRHGYLVQGDKHSERHPKQGGFSTTVDPLCPPDLIVQDELHLISGPLGSLVGHYETAIDWLCSISVDKKVSRPKIIASTATIRRAPEQIRAVFNRDIRLFPPPGLDISDSYFAKEQIENFALGRMFVGLSAPGKSMKTALVRVYANLLTVSHFLFQQGLLEAEPYMTLVGYFNSLRELGGALRLVEDDVRSRMKLLAGPNRYNINPRRFIDQPAELTSNVDASKIPEILSRLEKTFLDPQKSPKCVDVLLASNMISVGIDIDRLGSMVVTGQPKTTSEYIQASSRVGRKHPGLIVTVFKWSRPRDLSHYERFASYHSSLYRHVEAISVTPFSSRARDRALHAIFVTMARHGIPGWNDAQAAALFDKENPVIEEIRETIRQRVSDLAPDRPELVQRVDGEIAAIIDTWTRARDAGRLRYAWQSPYTPPPATDTLLLKAAEEDGDGIWSTQNSLRTVEGSAHLFSKDLS